MFKAIRESFATDDDLRNITSIPSENLIAKIPSSAEEESSGAAITRFNALKSALNKKLNNLMEQKLNPLAIVVGDQNTFVQSASHDKETKKPKSLKDSADPQKTDTPRRAFKESEITFKLPVQLQKEFEERLEQVKAMEAGANEKIQAMMAKEKELEETRLRMDQENADARLAVQKKLDEMQSRYENEKELHLAEITRLKTEIAAAQKECESIRDDRNKTLIEYEERRAELEKVFFQRETLFKERFEELSAILKQAHNDEKNFSKLKKQELQRIKTKEKQLNAVAEQQIQRSQELNVQSRTIEASRKKLKARLEKEYQEKLNAIKEDFNRRSEYHYRRAEEEEKEKEWLLNEKQKLMTKEQAFSLEIKVKREEQNKKQQEDLDKRLSDLGEREILLLQSEEELTEEKKKILEQMKIPRNAKVIAGELKILIEEQQKIVNNRKKLLALLKAERAKKDTRIQDIINTIEKEKVPEVARMKEEFNNLIEEHKRLKEKEQALVLRETTELARLNEEFEELRVSLEVGQIEKEETFEQTREKIQEEENKVREKQRAWLEKEKEEKQRIEHIEEESLNHLNETFKARDELMKHHEEVSEFMKHFHFSYQQQLEFQNTEYDAFKKNIEVLKAEAERLTRNLEEKEKTVRAESTATLQAFGERLKQREDLVDNMEKDLRNRLQEYRSFVSELQHVKSELVEQDQNRKLELMTNLSHYESRLTGLAKAFEDLSDAFQLEKERGTIEIASERETLRPSGQVEYSDDIAKMEWQAAIRNRLNPSREYNPVFTDRIYKLAEKWDQWIPIPRGRFLMGNKRSKDAAPFREELIEKPFQIKKYPVTNIEFYQFVNETDYKTEAESGIVPIVYHNGQARQIMDSMGVYSQTDYSHPTLTPDAEAFWLRPNGHPNALDEKFHHPVTQVTWNDAMAYCAWKSEITGKKFRLPTESEWEYVASSFGRLEPDEFYWDVNETIKFCNIEESGIGDSTPVDFFPETEFAGGAQDLFGNVYEWVLDACKQGKPPANKLTYKLARGGSFITPFKHIAHWRRISFAMNYCTSFLGFRVVRMED